MNSSQVDPTHWFAIPSIPGFCWDLLVAQSPVANGAAYLRLPLFSSRYGTNLGSKKSGCGRSSASRMKPTLDMWRR